MTTAAAAVPGDAALYRCVIGGCAATLLGIVASGPLAVALVELTHPQPR